MGNGVVSIQVLMVAYLQEIAKVVKISGYIK